ncbi:MAG: flagellar hook protein [Ilumatobacteraceae bacterium]|nr:flagellar hook protein [Ilumatobacteraceae bacterium]
MSTIPRITFLGANRNAQLRLQNAYGRLDIANEQVATGKAYSRPSDDTSASSRAAVVQNQLDHMGTYDRAIDDSKSHLSVADTKMSQAVALYQRVTELTTQAANSTNSPGSLDAINQEIVQIKGELQAIGNTTYLGQPVFGGLDGTDPVSYDSATSTWTFSGSPTDRLTRSIGPGEKVDVSVTASEIFSNSANGSIFSVLDQLSADLTSGNIPGISSALGKISSLRSTLSAGQARIGAVANRVDDAATRNSALKITYTDELSKLQDVDLPVAITDQSRLSVAYQSALAVTAKAQEKTLMDWLG